MTREEMVRSHDLDGSSGRTGKRGIAVTRFANLTAEPGHDYFCAGLTDDLISALTKIDELRVFARPPGQSWDGQRPEYVIEGSVRKQADRLRIAVQLVDTSKNCYLWSETYEREISDVFAIQDEISKAIAGALRKRISE